MQIINKPLSELKPAPYNPRVTLQPVDPRYRKLKRSIERFGLVEPLLWNRQTGYLVGGHQRLRIITELGYHEAPVSVVDLPADLEMALNIVLNNREAQGDWDMKQLTKVLEELAQLPTPQLAASGFDPRHLKMLQSELSPVEEHFSEEPLSDTYEVLMRIPMSRMEMIRTDLDALIDHYQLEVHIKHR